MIFPCQVFIHSDLRKFGRANYFQRYIIQCNIIYCLLSRISFILFRKFIYCLVSRILFILFRKFQEYFHWQHYEISNLHQYVVCGVLNFLIWYLIYLNGIYLPFVCSAAVNYLKKILVYYVILYTIWRWKYSS